MLETSVQCLCVPFQTQRSPLIWIGGIVRAMSIEELATAVEMQIGVSVSLCESR